jgi:transposase
MSETFSKVEVITGVARRRRFTTEQKLLVVNETLQPGMSISYVARRHALPEPGLQMSPCSPRAWSSDGDG